jgi:hypothetical protein
MWVLYEKQRLLKILILAVLSIFPLVGVIAVSLLSPHVTVLIPRIIMVFAPPILVLVAMGLTAIPSKLCATGLLVASSALCSLWLYGSSYYTIPTKTDFRALAREIAQLDQTRGDILLINLAARYIIQARADYYWNMFKVDTEKVFFIPKDVPAAEGFHQIQTAARRDGISKIVLFSVARFDHKDLLGLCDKYFQKEEEKVFTSMNPASQPTFLATYSLERSFDDARR